MQNAMYVRTSKSNKSISTKSLISIRCEKGLITAIGGIKTVSSAIIIAIAKTVRMTLAKGKRILLILQFHSHWK